MSPLAGFRVMFSVAAGPRIGFGHLVRCRSLARALGVAPVVVVRGTAATRLQAAASGWRIVSVRDDAALRDLNPQLLVIDDPAAAAVRTWVRRARRLGVAVATVHDLGLGAVESDLAIDGSVESPREIHGRFGSLRGPAYAILDPLVRAMRDRCMRPAPRRVLIALGGGAHVGRLAARLSKAIAARVDDVEIHAAAGFMGPSHLPALVHGQWIDARDGLAEELSSASVAVVGGGVTLYEACALGIPAIAVALTPPQHLTIRAIVRRGAAVDGGAVGDGPRTIARLAHGVERLLRDRAARDRLGTGGRRLVDGRGVLRIAARLRQLAAASDRMHHAA